MLFICVSRLVDTCSGTRGKSLPPLSLSPSLSLSASFSLSFTPPHLSIPLSVLCLPLGGGGPQVVVGVLSVLQSAERRLLGGMHGVILPLTSSACTSVYPSECRLCPEGLMSVHGLL